MLVVLAPSSRFYFIVLRRFLRVPPIQICWRVYLLVRHSVRVHKSGDDVCYIAESIGEAHVDDWQNVYDDIMLDGLHNTERNAISN